MGKNRNFNKEEEMIETPVIEEVAAEAPAEVIPEPVVETPALVIEEPKKVEVAKPVVKNEVKIKKTATL